MTRRSRRGDVEVVVQVNGKVSARCDGEPGGERSGGRRPAMQDESVRKSDGRGSRSERRFTCRIVCLNFVV